MSVPLYVGNIPNRLTGPETFSADTDIYHAWLPTAITAWNADIAALNTNDTRDTSTSSNAISAATSKTFTVSAGKSFSKGQWLTIAVTDSPTVNSMVAQVSSYSGTTLVVDVPANGVFGSGTFAAWTIALTGAPSVSISAAMIPVTTASTLATGRTALGITPDLQSLTASVATNALTVTLNPTTIDFRPVTLTTGVPNTRTISSAISLVAPSGASFGAANARLARLIVLAIDNAGTVELALINLAGGVNINEQGLITTVAMSAGATSATTAYSTTARTSVPYRVVGAVDLTEVTAGVYATAPSLVQPIGGQALASMGSFGFGQTRQDVTGSRTLGTTYYNTTGKPKLVRGIAVTAGGGFGALALTIGGLSQTITAPAGGYGYTISDIVLHGEGYSITSLGTPSASFAWHEIG